MKSKSSFISGFLFVAILIANVSYAQAMNKSNDVSVASKYIKEKYIITAAKKAPCEKCDDLKEKYNLLFKEAEKYVPGIAQRGEQLYEERNNLKKELGIALKKQRESSNLNTKEEIKKEISYIMKDVEKGKITKKEGERQLEKKRVQYQDKIKDFRKEYRLEHKKEIKARKNQKEKTKKAFEKFVKAVEAGEASSIEKTFNDYYENSKALNEMLRQYLNDVKVE
jgi:dGTP triphosphohydrolase